MTDHLYQPLRKEIKEVRILVLHPAADRSTPLSCTFELVTLLCPVEYESLSWHWSDSKDTSSLLLQGVEKAVPSKLLEVLVHLRFTNRPRRVWADAICINQTDLQERAEHVVIMKDIYRQAIRTIVWLGPMESSEDKYTFNAWKRLSKGITLRQLVLEDLDLWDDSKPLEEQWSSTMLDEQEEYEELLAQLSAPFELTWWTRLWIVQEVALASRVDIIWGFKSMCFHDLLAACKSVLREMRKYRSSLEGLLTSLEMCGFSNVVEDRVEMIEHMQSLVKYNQQTRSLMSTRECYLRFLEAIVACRCQSVTDERDRVYGLLGMAPCQILQTINPSYAISAEDLFSEIAHKIMEETQTFITIGFVVDSRHVSPTWARRWEEEHTNREDLHTHSHDLRMRIQQEDVFRACATFPWSLQRLPDNMLEVRGFRLDLKVGHALHPHNPSNAAGLYGMIQRFADTLRNSYSHAYIPDNLDRTWKNFRNMKYIAGGDLMDALCQTLLSGCAPSAQGIVEQLSTTNLEQFLAWLADVDEQTMRHATEWNIPSDKLTFPGVQSPTMCEYACMSVKGKKFFTTALGYCGLTSYASGEIWILAGASHPVMLAPVKNRPGCYYPLAEAYVHGVMYGEAVRGECPRLDATCSMDEVNEVSTDGRMVTSIPRFGTIYIV